MQHFNGLTPAQAERLALLIEELAEAQQAACKILRHGYESRDPTLASAPSNRLMLEKELGHVLNAQELMFAQKDISPNVCAEFAILKRSTIKAWLHHQEN